MQLSSAPSWLVGRPGRALAIMDTPGGRISAPKAEGRPEGDNE
jgi:hypothetical protein